MRGTHWFGALAIMLGTSSPASAQLLVTSLGAPATEAFTAFRGVGFAPSPAAGQLDSDTWIVHGASAGPMAYGDTQTTGDFARGQSPGGVISGGVYAFEIATGNFAFGVQSTGSDFTPGSVEVRVRNDTGLTVTSFDVTYTGAVYNDQLRSTEVSTLYSTDGMTFAAFGVPYLSPAPADSPPAWLTLPATAVISGVFVPPGGFLYVRFAVRDAGGSGSRDELALDNVAITAVTAAPPCMTGADCVDMNPCTADVCLAGACSNPPQPAGSSCADADVCNGDETCDLMGLCQPGPPPLCDDMNLCTVDSCDATLGCQYNAVGAGTACDDTDRCNGAEVCMGTVCMAGSPLDCDDLNPCTADACDALLGCTNVAVADGTSCADMSTCNGDEVCVGAACMAGVALDCDDMNPCTADSCDATTGCANDAVAGGTACPDVDLCNGDETCDGAGVCGAGAALDCDDMDVCTTDSCDATSGCANDAIPMCASDAGVGDGGASPADGGVSGADGSVSGADAGASGGDAGTGPGTDGCSCRASGRGSNAPIWLAALAGLALLRRRR